MDIEVLAETLALPPLPFPLDVPSPRATSDAMRADLADRGLMAGGALSDALVLLACGEFVIDGRLAVGRQLDLVGAVRGDRAALAVRAGDTVQVSLVHVSYLTDLIVDLLPPARQLPGNSTTMPHDALVRALRSITGTGTSASSSGFSPTPECAPPTCVCWPDWFATRAPPRSSASSPGRPPRTGGSGPGTPPTRAVCCSASTRRRGPRSSRRARAGWASSSLARCTSSDTEMSVAYEVDRARRGLFQFPLPEWVRPIPIGASWMVALVTPPGRPAALLSVTGFQVPGQRNTTDLLKNLEDRGGPCIAGARLARLEHGRTALLLHRTDSSGSQAQAFVPDERGGGGGCFLFTLAARQPDRGPDLLELIRTVVTVAGTAG